MHVPVVPSLSLSCEAGAAVGLEFGVRLWRRKRRNHLLKRRLLSRSATQSLPGPAIFAATPGQTIHPIFNARKLLHQIMITNGILSLSLPSVHVQSEIYSFSVL